MVATLPLVVVELPEFIVVLVPETPELGVTLTDPPRTEDVDEPEALFAAAALDALV